MNSLTKSRKTKKFILILVFLILTIFCYPKSVKAALAEDIIAAPAKMFWAVERGLLTFINNTFSDNRHQFFARTYYDGEYEVSRVSIYLTPENIINKVIEIYKSCL